MNTSSPVVGEMGDDEKGEELIPLHLVQGKKPLKRGQGRGQPTFDVPTPIAEAWMLLTGGGGHVGNARGGDSAQ